MGSVLWVALCLMQVALRTAPPRPLCGNAITGQSDPVKCGLGIPHHYIGYDPVLQDRPLRRLPSLIFVSFGMCGFLRARAWTRTTSPPTKVRPLDADAGLKMLMPCAVTV